MPKKPDIVAIEPEKPLEAEAVLVPFSVIIDGQDRTIFAKDEEDLRARVAKIRRVANV